MTILKFFINIIYFQQFMFGQLALVKATPISAKILLKENRRFINISNEYIYI